MKARSLREELASLVEFAQERRECPGEVWGLSTGFKSWDRLTGGLHRGQLTIVAARTGVGKTTLSLQVAETVAQGLKERGEDARVVVLSLEMSARELLLRMSCSRALVDAERLSQGRLSEEEHRRWLLAVRELADLDPYLTFWVSGSVTVGDLLVRTEEMHQECRIALLVVDYLGLIRGIGTTRYEQVSEVSRQLRALATGLDIPVLANAQLARPQDRSEDKPPSLFELRDSGSIEQDADNVLLLWRQPVTDRFGVSVRSNLAVAHLAKQRQGRPGAFHLVLLDGVYRFEERENGHG
jgi:replicative DNA helicase